MPGKEELQHHIEQEVLPSRYAIGVAGQGGTSIGEEYRDLYESSQGFQNIFNRAERLLMKEMDGFSIQGLCFEVEPERQKVAQSLVEQTLYSHLANTTIYAAKYAAFAEEYAGSTLAEFILPQSAGECAALYISGMTDFETALLVAKKRGELTEKAAIQNPGRMVYVAGFHGGYEGLVELCKEVESDLKDEGKSGVVAVSNRNSPKELIYSGSDEFVTEVTNRHGRKVVNLPISFGSHCDLMAPLVEEYREFLSGVSADRPSMTWILNGVASVEPAIIFEKMAVGPTQIVDYQSSIEELSRSGVAAMVEMTPNVGRRPVVGRYYKHTMDSLGQKSSLIVR